MSRCGKLASAAELSTKNSRYSTPSNNSKEGGSTLCQVLTLVQQVGRKRSGRQSRQQEQTLVLLASPKSCGQSRARSRNRSSRNGYGRPRPHSCVRGRFFYIQISHTQIQHRVLPCSEFWNRTVCADTAVPKSTTGCYTRTIRS